MQYRLPNLIEETTLLSIKVLAGFRLDARAGLLMNEYDVERSRRKNIAPIHLSTLSRSRLGPARHLY